MTNRERELSVLGYEYAEGIERAKTITLLSGREVRKIGDSKWEVQPWNDNYWKEFDDVVEAIKCGTKL